MFIDSTFVLIELAMVAAVGAYSGLVLGWISAHVIRPRPRWGWRDALTGGIAALLVFIGTNVIEAGITVFDYNAPIGGWRGLLINHPVLWPGVVLGIAVIGRQLLSVRREGGSPADLDTAA